MPRESRDPSNAVFANSMLENRALAEFSVKKTFAWGGIYGATTRMEDIEPAFAEAVATAIVGEAENKKE